jgi:hypothetical protein
MPHVVPLFKPSGATFALYSPYGLKKLALLIFRLAKIYEQKTFQRTAQRNSGLGNSLFGLDEI